MRELHKSKLSPLLLTEFIRSKFPFLFAHVIRIRVALGHPDTHTAAVSLWTPADRPGAVQSHIWRPEQA